MKVGNAIEEPIYSFRLGHIRNSLIAKIDDKVHRKFGDIIHPEVTTVETGVKNITSPIITLICNNIEE